MIRYIIPTLLLFTACTNFNKPKPDRLEAENDPFDIEVAQKEIDAANLAFIDLFNKSDSIGLANMFTEDGKSMEPNEPAFIGRPAIQAHYTKVMNAGANKLDLETTGLWGDESLLAEEGVFVFTDARGQQLDRGKYIVLWKKVNREWLLFRDCYNSDLPVPKN